MSNLAIGSVRALALAVALVATTASGQDRSVPALARNRYRSGEETLRAFAPVSEATRTSIVKLNVNSATVALATIMTSDGLALTKASEIKKGKLTAWLATEKEVDAEILATDEDEDVALVRVHGPGLKPVRWASDSVSVGQWAITPGIADTPQAVGIISALPRRIRPTRAYIGIEFDLKAARPQIAALMEGLGAEKAGLKQGDIIVRVNETGVTNREQVIEIVRDFREGQILKLRLQRAGQEFEKDIKLMPLPASLAEFGFGGRRGLGELNGAVSTRAEGFEQAIEHDTVLQPWLCGGPLVNLDGQAVGLNIAHASRVSTYALPAPLVKSLFEKLSQSAVRRAGS
ncbi:MAG: hypothetical protein C5B50_03980 [Verrucomicrobia bacterium]|nr:MAG: hypothetical protein C5B50_03980 [Verrucomicrobiota bacterium]